MAERCTDDPAGARALLVAAAARAGTPRVAGRRRFGSGCSVCRRHDAAASPNADDSIRLDEVLEYHWQERRVANERLAEDASQGSPRFRNAIHGDRQPVEKCIVEAAQRFLELIEADVV